MENEPSFQRIIGGTEKQKEKLQEQAEKASLKTGEELFGEYLIQPNPEEKRSIEKASTYANIVAKSYGATTQFDPDRIFLLEPGSIEIMNKGEIRSGICNSFNQSIAVERSVSNAILASTVFHEMLHMESYHSAQILNKKLFFLFNKTEDKPYRSGISMRGRKGEGNYFGLAEEAIIATLSKRFFNEVIATDPLYKEIIRTDKIKEWLNTFAQNHIEEQEKRDRFATAVQDILILPENEMVYKKLYNSGENDDYKFGYFMGFFEDNLKSGNIIHERAEEREEFNKVLDKIMANSKGKITDRNRLFDEFARAHFTGNYLPLARTVEDILGEGSFRQIAIELGEMK